MGGKRPKTAKSGKSGKGKKKLKGDKSKDAIPEEKVIEEPKNETQKDCLVCTCIMVEPVKLEGKWFCLHCIK